MGIVITVILIGLIPAAIASSKGRNFFLWWLYGMALFIVALPHSLIMGPGGSKRKCPHCGEKMLTTASVCPHCNRDVAPTSTNVTFNYTPKASDANLISIQRTKTGIDAAWNMLKIGKRLKITLADANAMVWNIESEDGLLGTVSGADAKRIAFFAETDGQPRGTVVNISETDDEGAYCLGLTLSAMATKLGEYGDYRKCPFCAESILKEAIKCKHCGSDLAPMSKPLRQPEQEPVGWLNQTKLMNKYGITFDGNKFVFQEHKYDRLDDAIAWARKIYDA